MREIFLFANFSPHEIKTFKKEKKIRLLEKSPRRDVQHGGRTRKRKGVNERNNAD